MILQNKYNLEFFQGSTFTLNLTIKNSDGRLKDLTGASARMQIRPSYNSSTITESITTSNGEITINTSSSSINLVLSANRTANISVNLSDSSIPPRSKYVYDFELQEADQTVSKILYGEVTVFGEVTR
jgi:hypothetical protein